MNGVKNFAVSFAISLIIFGLIAFIIVQFVWPSDSGASDDRSAPAPTEKVEAPTDPELSIQYDLGDIL